MTGRSEPEQLQLRVAVLTASFQIRGTLRAVGILQTFINDEQKGTLTIHEAEVTGITANNPVRMTKPEVVVSKRAAQLILFEELPPASSLTLLPRSEQLVMYVDAFAAAGKFYMGQDARIADFADASLQQFLSISDLKVYPVIQARNGLVSSAPLAMIHKLAIRIYHQA